MDKSNIVYLPGLKLEVKDYNDVWLSARVVEVDAQGKDVLIHFDDMATRSNEWIPMDSSRLKMTTQPPEEQTNTFQISENVIAKRIDGTWCDGQIKTSHGNDKETETSSQNADVIQTPEPARVVVKTKTQTLVEIPVNPIESDQNYSSIVIGSLRVKTKDGALKCPKGCKSFRTENFIKQHIKNYHKELVPYLDNLIPNVADLAYARTAGKPVEDIVSKKSRKQTLPPNHVKLRTSSTCDKKGISKAESESQTKIDIKAERGNSNHEDSLSEISNLNNCTASPGTSFDMRNKDKKARTGIKVLLPVRRSLSIVHNVPENFLPTNAEPEICRPSDLRGMKKRLTSESSIAPISKKQRQFSEIDNSFSLSDDSVFDRDDTLDSSNKSSFLNSSELANSSASDTIPPVVGDTILENDELIKVEELSEEDIVNCICCKMEEDGLMIQCDLCQCWQHGICNAIERKEDVPDEYICYFCRKNDQGWLHKGTLPKLSAVHINAEKDEQRSAMLKRAFDIMKMVLEIKDVLHSLRVKINIAQNKDHPKLYLWAKSWSKIKIPSYENKPVPLWETIQDGNDNNENSSTDIKIPSYENKPVPSLKTIKDENDNSVNAKIDNLPNTSDDDLIEILGEDENEISLTSSMNLGFNDSSQSSIFESSEEPWAPKPEAPIVSVECKSRLLEHIENLQEWVDSTLNFVEVQIEDLEKKFEWSPETNDQYMHTSQTLLMVLRDLENVRNYSV
ncbi:PHD finger protein 20-like protein 1 isoform X3 [Trichogramma pretiosum]|uniref:PHD finger protein 20-like protein 1 isoform X2 n=1 Tax=Trichogramma pretiosum TaxID=7493 RepID=UPI000C7190E9|nr:PHD finger protein 20-like protein 1 isoform X2 [Trichogramma pretiosum]XP_023315237.1 PHD finger protein 20-like protein 1 isoform X3 [Trichogramma pretiosum]